MITDDMLPDEALVSRAEHIADSLEALALIVGSRRHLPQDVGDLAARAREVAQLLDEAARADDPVESELYRGRRRDDGFLTYSGVWFYPLNPRVEDVRHVDIVQGLLHTCRYNGQLPRLLSVAEHSIKVAAITEHLLTLEAAAGGISGNLSRDTIPVACLHALLHDAHEAFLGDLIGPIKGSVGTTFGVPWTRVEDAVQQSILTAYSLPPLSAEAHSVIAQADKWMRYCECIVLVPDHPYGFDVPPSDVDRIGRVKQTAPDPAKVRELFDGEIRRLVKLCGGTIPEGAPSTPVPALRVPRVSAAEKLAEVVGDMVPGARTNPPPPPEKQAHVTPNLSRPQRSDDITQGQWSTAIRSAEVRVPSELMQEPEFRRESGDDGGA